MIFKAPQAVPIHEILAVGLLIAAHGSRRQLPSRAANPTL